MTATPTSLASDTRHSAPIRSARARNRGVESREHHQCEPTVTSVMRRVSVVVHAV